MANIQIDIAENGTTTLATEGKLCDRNIDINVNVESSGGTEIEDALISGTISGAYRNDRVTSVRSNAFRGLAIANIDLPNVDTLYDSALSQCKSLKEVNLPKARILNSYTFDYCTALENITLPNATNAFTYCFRNCTALTRADFGILGTIQNYCFQRCTALTALILRKNTKVASLSSTTAFVNTPIADGTGYIYVTDDLVEQYKVATNWSTYADQIKPISELEE